MHAAVRASRAEAGFTLAEVLVALFVVALGIAGAAGVQAMALRSARAAARMSDGVQLAAALAERMRANPAALALADADNPYLHLDYATDTGLPPSGPACYGASACDTGELARFDLAEAAHELGMRFAGARILACRDASASDPSGEPSWSCSGEAGAPLVIKLGWREADEAAALPRVVLPMTGAGTPVAGGGA
ncbi:MAG: type IV pilus modification protein PilV [Oxalobacteraceae bacterium]|jgi:type IV pilus assembly protein PilV|nr:MAG: type IV pilus modification protein PilV [Oxalobacteraceae bacterium]